ncbi:hypothetical protein GGF46_003613 [Coemansia sp. RSA 552]|nr:hypothetical protein GGF46_003613 [Coemansia sp. RSA 552]
MSDKKHRYLSDGPVPLPSGRDSDGGDTISVRSSVDDDRAGLFASGDWRRESTALPAGVRDPLNIDELEREERLMPYTEMAVGEMGRGDTLPAAAVRDSARPSGLSQYMAAGQTQSHPETLPSAGKGGIDWAYMQDHNLRTGGLPSLDQVLTRRTRAPLALRDFAVHCSVRQPQARRWLEFYMAARTHEKMCLAYESDLRHAKARSHYADSNVLPLRSQRTSRYADEKADPARRAAAQAETIESLSRNTGVQEIDDEQEGSGGSQGYRRSRRQSSRMALQIQTAAETIFMRYFRAALDPNLQGTGWQSSSVAAQAVARAQAQSSRGKIGSLKRMLTQKPSSSSNGSRGVGRLQPELDDPYHQGYGVAGAVPVDGRESADGANSAYNNVQGQLGSTASLTMSREYLNRPITAGEQLVPTLGTSRGLGGAFGSSRHHLYYSMPWPPEILTDIEQRLLRDGAALDSRLFSDALLYAYDVLDTYYFPIFIADAVSRNVTRDHCVLRVFVAFLLLWFGFALPLVLILLDHDPKAERVWSILPQLLGWWNIAVGFGGCDPLLAAMRKYQSPMMKEDVVPKKPQPKEGWSMARKLDDWHRAWFSTRVSVDMTATRMVRARSIRWLIGAVVMTGISTAILCAVPGTHIYKN